MSTMTETRVDAQTEAELREIEMNVLTEGVTLSTLIREGISVLPIQSKGWGEYSSGCALATAFAGARARGLV